MKCLRSVHLLSVVKLSQVMRHNGEKCLGCKLRFIVHRWSETFFAPLNIKDIMLLMQPRNQARLYTELSVTVVQL